MPLINNYYQGLEVVGVTRNPSYTIVSLKIKHLKYMFYLFSHPYFAYL